MTANPAMPRTLVLDLGRPGDWGGPRPWGASARFLERIGSWSGGALGLAALAERAFRNPTGEAPLVLSVGELVRRGFPTAARASVASRAPLTGLLAEGLVGGDLARRLASVTDALVLEGCATGPGAVLAIDADGRARLERWPDLAGASPRRVHAVLQERLGPCGTLSIGLAGERELPLSSLAAGGAVPHFVGRGGLGAVLGHRGLKALAVCAPEVPSEGGRELAAALARSPRLIARAEGGTLELYDAFAAGVEGGSERAALRRLGEEARASRSGRHGCAGCPTPCGWEFDTRRGAQQSARFGASHALARALEFSSLDDALTLLALCDELGLDAKELGAGLALLAPRGLDEALARVREACDGRGEGARLALGSVALARELGRSVPSAKGAAVRPDASLASLLGQCVSSRGGDPMRTFPFLAVDGADLAAFRASTGLDLPDGAADPLAPAGKGRLVAWHEDWANALDTTGFCAFSAAALLADGTLGVAELSRALAPAALAADGLDMLGAGAVLSTLQRRLNETWGVPARADVPEWARERLAQPGAWDEYARIRGLDGAGRLLPERLAALERLALPATGESRAARPSDAATREPSSDAAERQLGSVVVRRMGAEPRELSLELPASVASVLAALARADESTRGLRPSVFRDGRALGAGDLVHAGDGLDLVVVVAGG